MPARHNALCDKTVNIVHLRMTPLTSWRWRLTALSVQSAMTSTPDLITPDTIGYVAATLTSLSFVPQAVSVLRTRNVEGLSLPMYAMFCTGVAGWLLYGLVQGAAPIVAANMVTLTLASLILVQILRARVTRTALPAR